MAATITAPSNIPIRTSNALVPHSKPAVNSNESPGRKKPKNRPVSANTTATSKVNPPTAIMLSGLKSCLINSQNSVIEDGKYQNKFWDTREECKRLDD